MYEPVSEEEISQLTQLGYLKVGETPGCETHLGCMKLHMRNNPIVSKPLFRLNYQLKSNSLVFSDVESFFTITDNHTYELYMLASLKKMEELAEEFSMDKIFVQSSDPRILEGFFEREFDMIDISTDGELKVFSAIKRNKVKI